MKIRQKIALNYIRKHMSHSTACERNEILKTLNEAMALEFSEDNCHTRLYSLIKWLIQNNEEFKDIYRKHGVDYLNLASESAKDGVLEAYLK